MPMRMCLGSGLVLAGLLAWLCVASVPRAAADEEVARFLIQQAKKATSLGKLDEAVSKLERAREEAPELLEAAYLLGQVFEKKKEPGKALGAYRAFRDGCLARSDALDKKIARLLPRAQKRIAVLGKGEKELEKLQKAFGERIVRFAARHDKADTDIAVEALRRLLSVVPDHAGAKRQLADLVGTDDPTGSADDVDPDGTPVAGIRVWDDLLRRRAIPPGKFIQYKRKVMTIDQEGGTIFWTDPYKRAPDPFVYEVEFRFTGEHAPGYLLGLAFARNEDVVRGGSDEFVMAFAQRSSLVMVQASGGRNVDIGESAIPSKPLETWRRLVVAVEGRKVRVYLDGEAVLNSSVPGRRELTGPIGVFHQRSVVEIRKLRLGTKE